MNAAGKPIVLDICCRMGGATVGYQRAGFYVIGVDIDPQPGYPGDEFHQGGRYRDLAVPDQGSSGAGRSDRSDPSVLAVPGGEYQLAKMLIESGVAKENIGAEMRAQMTEAERKDLGL